MKKQKINKKEFLLLFLLFSLIPALNTQLYAQEKNVTSTNKEDMSVGVRFGYSSSAFHNHYYERISEEKIGYSAGIFFNYGITGFLSVSAEALYIRQGARDLDPDYIFIENNTVNNKIINSNITSHTIEFPVFINYPIFLSETIIPKVYIGGVYNLNIYSESHNYLFESGLGIISEHFQDVTPRFVYHDFAALAGCGVNVIHGNIVLTFDVRYRMGLMNINNTESLVFDNTLYSHTFSILLGVGYKF